MADFRHVTDTFWASPQIALEDIATAKKMGVSLLINNRPDGEDEAAPQGADIEAAAKTEGLSYFAIPVGHSGMSEPQIDAMLDAIEGADGTVLAYCRSGTRSTLLWSLAQAKKGLAPEEIAAAAMQAGYDVSPIRPLMDMLAAR